MSANCKSCGKIMAKPEDYSEGNIESQYCSSCTNANGFLKSLDEITLHIANQLIMSQGIDREAATKAARSILSMQPEWKKQFKDLVDKRLARNRLFIIGLSILLMLSTTIAIISILSRQNPIYPTLFTDIQPTIIKNITDNVEIMQISLPDDQRSVKIDENDGSINFNCHDRSYQMTLDKDKVSGELLFESQYNDSRFVGSCLINGIKTSFWLGQYKKLNKDNDYPFGLFCVNEMKNKEIIHISDVRVINKIVVPSQKYLYDSVGYSHTYPIDFNVKTTNQYITWISDSYENDIYQSIHGYNILTGKSFPICQTFTEKANIQAGNNTVFWEDYGIPNAKGFEIKGFDLLNMKEINTGIKLQGSMNSFGNNRFFYYDNSEPVRTIWRVSQDNIIIANYSSNIKTDVYNFRTKSNKHVILPGTLSESEKLSSKDYENKTLHQQSFGCKFFTIDWKGKPTMIWLSKDNNGKHSIQSNSIYDMASYGTVIETGSGNETYKDFIGVSGNWVVWVEALPDLFERMFEDYKISIKAGNLKTGKTKNLGKYNCFQFFNYNFDVCTNDAGIVWTAISDDGSNDIFFAKLPEGK